MPRNETGDERTRPLAAPTSQGRLAGQHADLHICPACGSGLVYPVEWGPVGACRWRVELRCPECEWERAGTYEQSVLDRFDAVLDAATDSLVADLRRLQRSNMEEELERFNLALSGDLILPEDF